MNPLGKSSKRVLWKQSDPKKQNSESSFHPIQPTKIPTQRVSRHNRKVKGASRHTRDDLSQDDMLFLLSVLEGELQARDEVITVLKSERTDSALLEAHYGFSRLEKVLHALRRDSLQTQQGHLQDMCKKPTAELINLAEAQRQASKQMQEQLLEVSSSHMDALRRLEEQERNHRAFINKSNCLTTALQEDRERLKLLIVKEREYQELKERNNEREVLTLKEELSKLKAFALLVVKEQQCLSELLEEQRCHVKELTAITDHIKQEVGTAHRCAKEEKEHKLLHPAAEQLKQVSIFGQTHQTMTAKLVTDGTHNQQLRQQLVVLGHGFNDLEGARSIQKKADKEYRELNEQESGTPSLLSEVELLRRRVVEMEGKDVELIRMRDQCQKLDHRLVRETEHCCRLREEVDKLNGRINELDRIEEALAKTKHDCNILHGSLEKEREISKVLSGEVDNLKVKVRELEDTEGQLQNSEAVIRHDLAKLRSLTIVLVEDRKTLTEKLRQAEDKLSKRENQKNEQSNLTTMTERLREEWQQALRTKTELEERIMGIAKERDEFQARLTTEEERNGELQSKMSMMKKRLQVLENRKEKEEKYMHSSISNITNHHCQTDEIRVKELTKELDRLQKHLKDKEILEKELVKVEEDFESLEKRFKDEQAKSKALTKELEMAKNELSGYQQAEKQEMNQEHLLLCRLQKEQVKSRLLGREVDALKEKLQRLMGTEESISRVQMDHSMLQRKLNQQEARNRELAREMRELNIELDQYRQVKNLTPEAISEHVSGLYQATKQVQTEPAGNLLPDYSCQVENFDEENDDDDPNHNVEVIKRRDSTHVHNLNSLNCTNNLVSQNSSNSTNGISMQQMVNGEVMMLTHTPGQPLHIKVTPHHILNTATLEISSPTADTATSYTSTAVIPTGGTPPKQRITIFQSSVPPTANAKTPTSKSDRTISPLIGTPTSRMFSPTSSRSVTPDYNNSPMQISTVGTCSPEPTEVKSQSIFCKTPERQKSWQHLSSSSTDTKPSIITTEDNKIHIHLGSPYLQSHCTSQSVGPYYFRHEQRTQVLTNGCHVKGVGKISSSITLSPSTSPASHSSNITVSGICD